jgi:protein TonB
LTDNKPADNKASAPVPAKPGASPSQPKLTAAPANANAAASTSNAAAKNTLAPVNNASAPAVKRAANNAPAPPASSGTAAASQALVLGMPDGAALAASNQVSAPVVKTGDDLPPPPSKTVAKASLRAVSAGVLNGKAIEMPKPVYPETARRAKLTGIVTVEVMIDASGKVIGARAVSGPEMLRDAAERAARQAKFTPALLSGQPVRVAGLINYNFSL